MNHSSDDFESSDEYKTKNMKKIITTLAIAIMFLGVQALGDNPPHPNGGANPTEAGSGNNPVGGGAPIGSGMAVLMALGAAYGIRNWKKSAD